MKIIQFIPELDTAGAEIIVKNLAIYHSKMRNDVVVVSFYKKLTKIVEELKENSIEVIYLNKKKGIDLSIPFKISKLIKHLNPDILHTHRYVLPYVFLGKFFSSRKPRIYHTVHSIASKEVGKLQQYTHLLLFKVFKVKPVGISRNIKKTIEDRYNIKSVPVIFNGINQDKCMEKTSYELINDTINIIHIGRFTDAKNHIFMVDSISELINRNVKCTLSLYGNGELKTLVNDYIKNRDLENYIKIFSNDPEVVSKFNNYDVLILPSKWEGMPVSIIEAMSCGMPIIASNVGGISEMIVDNFSGVLIDAKKSELVEAIIKIKQSVVFRKMIGQNAKSESLNFSGEQMATNYLDLYRGIQDE